MAKTLENLAYIDDLTGLHNRRYLNSILPKEIEASKKRKAKLSLFMIDYDGFKHINDTYGHPGGDLVLLKTAEILKNEIGNRGAVTRYAGDEFTVVLPGTGIEEAKRISAKLLKSASDSVVMLKDGRQISSVTLSIGIALFPHDADSAEALIEKADQALYSSKRTGKNKASTMHDLVAEARDRDFLAKAFPSKKFIGRHEEMESLSKTYRSAGKGKNRVIIKGDRGVGKTRLMTEFIERNKIQPNIFITCRKEDREQQYGAIAEALNGFLDSMDARKVLDALSLLEDTDKYALLSTVAKIKDLPVRYSKGSKPAKDELGRKDMLAAFTHFIISLKLNTIPIFIDEISWIDKGSLDVVNAIRKDSGSAGSFIMGTLERGVPEAGGEKSSFAVFMKNKEFGQIVKTLDLQPLTEKEVSELLHSVFAGPLLPPNARKNIFLMSAGLPSHVEEIVRNLMEHKVIYRKDGRWALDEKRLRGAPTSLQEVFSTRLSNLDGESKDVLSRAAILGDDFNIDLLKSLYGKNEGELLDILDKLGKKGVLKKSASDEENVLIFANKAIRETIYREIDEKRARQLHRRVAGLLEQYHRSDIDSVYGKLHHHLKIAGDKEQLRQIEERADVSSYLKAEEISEPSMEEIMEAPLSDESAKIAPDVASCLRASWINSNLYPRDNKTRIDSIESLNRHLAAIFANDPTVTVTAIGEDIIFNGRQMSRKKVTAMIARGLVSLFSDYGINSVTFKKGLQKKELDLFFTILSEKEDFIKESGGFAALIRDGGISNIKVDDVRYRKASEIAARTKELGKLYKKILTGCPEAGKLFSVGDSGLSVNKDIISDTTKAIDSAVGTIKAISKGNISEDNKSFMILEGLRKIMGELEKNEHVKWKEDQAKLGRAFTALNPALMVKVTKDSSRYGGAVNRFISNTVSNMKREDIISLLKEAQAAAGMTRDDFSEFLKGIAKSQDARGIPHQELQGLFKDAGIKKEDSEKILNDIFITSFFEKAAKDMLGTEASGALDKGAAEKLRPLVEALLIKGDISTVEKLVKNILSRARSGRPLSRVSAIKGIGKISEALLEKEVFGLCGAICNELSAHIKLEKDITVYAQCLEVLGAITDTLIHKRNLALVKTPLGAIRERAVSADQQPTEFEKMAKKTIGGILSPENMDILLLSFGREAKKVYLPIIELIAQCADTAVESLIKILSKQDDVRIDPFVTYMKKWHIAMIMKQMGDKALERLTALLDSENAVAVKNVVTVMGSINEKKYIPYIERALRHPNQEVQKEARNVIKKIKGEKE